MRPNLWVSSLFVAAVLLGTGCEPDTEVTTARLAIFLPTSVVCSPPEGPGRVEVVAAGDFASGEDTVEVLTAEDIGAVPIRKFPFETRSLTVALRSRDLPEFVAGAVHRRVDEDAEDTLLLLPLGLSCATPDPSVRVRQGGAVAPLPGGGYLIAGGLDDETGEGERDVIIVPKDENLSDILSLVTRRVGATATRSGDRVIIAGGAQRDEFAAEETFEIFDAASGALDPAVRRMCPDGAGVCRRRDHGATTLASGAVLLAGGVSQRDAPPLNTTVAIDPVTGELDEGFEGLTHARRLPQMLTLDDGTVVVGGGFNATGDFVTGVEALDSRAFRLVSDGALGTINLPSRPDLALVALPGARVVAIGGRGELEDRVTVLRFVNAGLADRTDIEIRDLPPLASAHAVALADERILLVGTDDSGDLHAFRVDVGRGLAEERGAPSQPTSALVACDDGAIAEVGEVVSAYRRELLRTPFDNPVDTLLPMDAEWLALDVATSYAEGMPGLEALVDGAPVNVAALTFGDVSISPDVAGPYSIVLGDDRVSRTIRVDPDMVVVDGCDMPRGSSDPVRIDRRAETLTIETDVGVGVCPIDGLEGRVQISIRLASGSRFISMAIAR